MQLTCVSVCLTHIHVWLIFWKIQSFRMWYKILPPSHSLMFCVHYLKWLTAILHLWLKPNKQVTTVHRIMTLCKWTFTFTNCTMLGLKQTGVNVQKVQKYDCLADILHSQFFDDHKGPKPFKIMTTNISTLVLVC